jgi:hypothetical protein
MPRALSELEIGFVGFALTLLIFAVQGFISVLLEGRQLHPGRVRPRLTNPLSVAIVVFSILLLVIAVFLGVGIARGWQPYLIGTLAGLGSIVMALLLVFYKEGFVGNYARFDDREDGVPW